MKIDTKALYLNSLAISFPVCIVGAIVAAAGKGMDSKLATAIGGILTLPLTLLLAVPCLAIVMFAPMALAAAIGANKDTPAMGKALALAALAAGAGWAAFVAIALHGMAFGK